MRDRLPTPGKENRVRIVQDNGQVVEGTLAYADGATQAGSTYTKGNVLPDDVCNLLGIDPVTSEPKDAWLGVIKAVGYSILTIEVQDIDGTPAAGVQVSGLTGVIEEKTYTGPDGKIFLILKEGSYTLSVPKFEGCIDANMKSVSASIGAGEVKTVLLKPVSNGKKSLTITSSSVIKFSSNVTSIDVFCCGGGGGGGGGLSIDPTTWGSGLQGGGGGGGYTSTRLDATIAPYVQQSVIVGAGGRGGTGKGPESSKGEYGNAGGSTSCLGVSVSGGRGGAPGDKSARTAGAGADGGSGGGGGGDGDEPGGSGGSDGGNGTIGQGRLGAPGGKGQGKTTRAFGEPTGSLCAEGGPGGRASGTSSVRGSGGGGGSSGGSVGGTGGSGRSGVIMLRWVTKI